VVAGALNLSWIVDGRRDDTPPGGALIFELWRGRSTGAYAVKVFYTAQTLEQMRDASPLTDRNPPARVPIFVPDCSNEDFSCSWKDFSSAMQRVIEPAFVSAQP
jgi:4-phytase / acid phosphatase